MAEHRRKFSPQFKAEAVQMVIGGGKNFITPEVLISERPAEAESRAVPGHWEGDLILGVGSSAIGTLVERSTRFTMLMHLPRMEAHGIGAMAKNGPALAGHGAEAVRDAIARTITTLPEQLCKSVTWDHGAEMAQHARLRVETGVEIYFCDPRSPWQRGTNENTNGLLRQYFPKGTDLSKHTTSDLEAVATALNNRPRKRLGWKTPAEALNERLLFLQEARCCVDSLDPGSTPPSRSPNASPKPAPHPASAASATRSTTHWPRARSGCTRPSSSAAADRGRVPTT